MSFDTLYKNMITLYEEEGKKWCDELPEKVDHIVKHFGITETLPYENLSYNYVVSGLMNNHPIVIKIIYDKKNLHYESKSLSAFKHVGSVNLLYRGDGFLLLEKSIPGSSLATMIDNDEDILLLSHVIHQLHTLRDYERSDFRNLQDLFSVFDQEWNFPNDYLHKVRLIRNYFNNQNQQQVLLHGDLHHDNILKHGNNWKVIDPKGIIGNPLYDATSFILNPIRLLKNKEEEYLSKLFARRIKKISELQGWSEQNLTAYSFMYTILSWIWALQDGTDIEYQQKCAKVFDNFMI